MADSNSITTRRGFLKAAAVTAAAATVAGGGGAIAINKLSGNATQPLAVVGTSGNGLAATSAETTTSLVAPVVQAQPVAQTAISSNSTQLVTDLAAATSDNSLLESELANAREKIAQLEQALSEKAAGEEQMRMQIDDGTRQIGALTGLVALYEQLDEVDVSDFISDGLNDMGAAITNLVDDIPGVQEGLTFGRNALDNLESEVPLVEGGRIWMLSHVERLQSLYLNVSTMLEGAVETVEPLLLMMSAWTQRVLRWLPFGFGQSSALLIEAVTELLDATPDSIDGAKVNVMQPLELWLGRADEEDIPLLSQVVAPMRERVLVSAETHLNKSAELPIKFNNSVKEPLRQAQEARATIRDSINAYRETNAV